MKRKSLYLFALSLLVQFTTTQLYAQVLLTGNGSTGVLSGSRSDPDAYNFTNNVVIVKRSNSSSGQSISNEINNILDGTVPETGGTSSKYFVAATTVAIKFEFTGMPPIVTKYVISGNAETGQSKRSPKDWNLAGSNDEVQWTLLDTRTNQFAPPDPFTVETKPYTFTNTTAYKFYRLNITSNQVGDNAISVTEFELWGTVPTQPVNLTDFVVKTHNSMANLSWTTASEQNNSHFNILRSGNGKDFELLTTLKGKGTSTGKNIYNYTDANPLSGISYYKLVQVDFDGQSEELKIEVLNMNIPFSDELVIIGTPEGQGVKAEFFSTENTKAVLQISDISGRLIGEQGYQLHIGKNTMSLLLELQNGIYVAKLTSKNNIRALKFSK